MTATAQLDVESFYHLRGVDLMHHQCQGLACFVARHESNDPLPHPTDQTPRVYCLGKCYAAPATGRETSRPIMEVHSQRPVVLERIVEGGALNLDDYRRRSGLLGLNKALTMRPEEVIAQLEASHLRGRGGAGFPTGKKWLSVAEQSVATRHVVANLDEGDPGAYIDRFIAELDPYCLLEGMAIAAYAVGARSGAIYVRCEYPQAIEALRQALAVAQSPESSGSGFLGTSLDFHVELVIGGGSYMCGEETAMLSAIENRRPVARTRPPYVSEQGLYGQPTVVNNVETLASVPWILRNGANEYAAMGFSSSRGTKVVSLNSLFCRPGLFEIDFGIPLRRIVEDYGGGLRTGPIAGLMVGGPLAGVIPPSLFDTRFGFEEMRTIGASVGHGGMVAFDERTSIAELVHHVFSFGAYESCGKCLPCRLGCPAIEDMLRSVALDRLASAADQQAFRDIVRALHISSLCGFGTGLAEFAQSVERHYGQELRSCFK